MLRRYSCAAVLVVLAVAPPIQMQCQSLRAEYANAAHLRDKYKGLTVDVPDTPVWIAGTDLFWYRKSVAGGHAFVLVDATAQSRKPAFDQDKLAAAYSHASGEKVTGITLPFQTFDFLADRTAIHFTASGSNWKCSLEKYVCSKLGPVPKDEDWDQSPQPENNPDRVLASPDGKWQAFIRNYNVYLKDKTGKNAVVLSTDGSEDNFYLFRSLSWSPDSQHLVAYRIRPGYRRMIHYIESSPTDQLQPKYSSMEYEKPGDVLDLQQPVLFNISARQEIPVDHSLFPNPYDLSRPKWWKDSRAFTFEYNQRGHQLYRLIEVNAETGAARSLITETSKTFIDYRRLVPNQYDTGKTYRHDVNDGKEIIWMSERDGWAHLYLYNGITGKLENQITKGDWVVRAVNYVDDTSRQIYFEASGMKPGEDPYFIYGYRINFDGTGLTPITPQTGDHQLVYSPDEKYYVDTWSQISVAPVMELRRRSDNGLVMKLEQGDISKLLAAGWRPPMVFTSLGRDHKTSIWGIIYKPANFDPKKKYRVIEDIYAGPQGSFVPKSFGVHVEPLTELGFVVVQIDGMGTNNRSKAFHDVAWHNLKDAGFPDRILWHNAAAAKYPWYDITHGVGIFGTSAGGQSAMGALLFHPEFYKVAVANSGSHDNRMDKLWWNEQWMGWPIGPQYAASSNVDNAYRLQGKLLLVRGEMDRNVDPSCTLQVVNALIKANKTFSMMTFPGGGHGAGGAYGQRMLEDFFVHNMLGVEPPDWNKTPPGHSGN